MELVCGPVCDSPNEQCYNIQPTELKLPSNKNVETHKIHTIRRQCYDPVGVGENVFLELTAALVNAVTVNVIKT